MCVGGLPSVVQQFFVGVRDKEADQRQRDDVEERNAPENLLDGSWQGLARIGRLGSREANQFCAAKSKGCSDEDRAEAFEAVVECAWMVPVFAADIATRGRTATTSQNDSEDAGGRVCKRRPESGNRRNSHESNDSYDFDDREDEFCLSVAFHSEEVYGYYQEEEYGDPGCVVDTRVPEVDRDGSSDDLQGHSDKPIHGIVPAHGESPCRIDEAGRVRGEGAGDREDDRQFTKGMDGAVEHHTDQ